MTAHPVLFTVEFRRKMAELSPDQRQEWLTSLAARARRGEGTARRDDPVLAQELREVARGCRLRLVDSVSRQLGPFHDRHLRALLEVPRERFVRPEDIERSAEDIPLPLDPAGLATISAPHAYLLSYRLLELAPGDRLVELGTGSGYGAALAAFIVGPEGRVLSFEIDPALATAARERLASEPNVMAVQGDAIESASAWNGAKKAVATFAVEELPQSWLRVLPEGGLLVAPVGARESDQRLVLAARRRGRIVQTDHGAVRYVKNRSAK
ncbi:MAG: protein-L-isoaspartate O-methyltransferase [Polyangiaceae bacterium]|nr:protein-L-isoaspartate O-methyltransferase [Polyangiaceae bacterium]